MAEPFALPPAFPIPVDETTGRADPGPFAIEPPYVEPPELAAAAEAEIRRRQALPPVVGPTGMPQRRRVVPGYFAAPGIEAAGEVFSMPVEGVVAADEALRSAARSGGRAAAGAFGLPETEAEQWGDTAALGYDVGSFVVDPLAVAGKGALGAVPFAMGTMRKMGEAVERGPVLYSRLLEFTKSPGYKSLPWSKGADAVYRQLSAMARKGKLSQQEVDHVFHYVDPDGKLSPEHLRELIEDQGAIVNQKVFASQDLVDRMGAQGEYAGPPEWGSHRFSRVSAGDGSYQVRALQKEGRYRDIPRTDAVDRMLESLTFKASKGRAGQYEVRDDKGRLLGHVVARTQKEAKDLLGKAAGTRAATHARAQNRNYDGGHVREINNVLHERMDRRPIDVGEGQGEDALFVQEVQSDWNRDATPPSGTHEFAAPSKRGDEGYEFEFDYADRMAAHASGVDVVGAQKKAILEPAAKRIRMAWGMPGNGRVNLSDVQMPEQDRLDAIQRIYDIEFSYMTLDEMLGGQDAEFARAVLDGILADAEEFGLSTDVMRDLNPNDLEVLADAVGGELAESRFDEIKRMAVRLANDPDSIDTREYEEVMSYVLGPEAIERDLDRIGSVQYVGAGLPPMRVFPEEVDLIPSMPWRDGAWIDLAARDILLTAALQDEKYIAVATQAMQDATPGIAYSGDLYKSGDGRLQGALRRVVRQIDPEAVVDAGGGDPLSVQATIKMTPKLKEYLLKYGLPAAALAGMTQAPGAEQFVMPEDGPFVAPQ